MHRRNVAHSELTLERAFPRRKPPERLGTPFGQEIWVRDFELPPALSLHISHQASGPTLSERTNEENCTHA